MFQKKSIIIKTILLVIILSSCSPFYFNQNTKDKLRIGLTHESHVSALLDIRESRIKHFGNKAQITNNGITSSLYRFSKMGKPGKYAAARYKLLTLEFVDSVLNGVIYSNSYDSEKTSFDFDISTDIVPKQTTKNEVDKLLGKPPGECKIPSNILHFQLTIDESYDHPPDATSAWIYHYGIIAGKDLVNMKSQEKAIIIFFNDDGLVVDKYSYYTIQDNWAGF